MASSSGASQPAFVSRGGSSCTIRYIAPSTLSPTSYGGWPASAWYSVAPSDQTSLASVACCPEATSGERYAGEPVTSPVWVSEASASARAMPKSDSFTWPVGRDQDVRGLHVAVHDAGRMGGGERVGGLAQDRRSLVG